MKTYLYTLVFAALSLYSVRAEVLSYEQFGAVGDGKTDDRAAIIKTHAAANERKASVRATDGKTYYLGPGEGTAIVKTDVDWGTAKFIIDDVNVVQIGSPAFAIESFSAPIELKDLKPFKKGAAKLAVKLPSDCMLIVENARVKRYIRYGLNQNAGSPQREVLIVRKNGTVDSATPVVWDFDAVTKATAYPIDARTLTVRGGIFTTIANQHDSKYRYHDRGIQVHRSNTRLENIRHEITGEGDHGAPYAGFITIARCANVQVKDCVFTAHKTYMTQGHGGKVSMGSYDLQVNTAANTSIVNCRQLTPIDDGRYWGLFASNYSKNILFDHVEFSRFDAHMGVANATILNSRLGYMGINAIGFGTFRVENTEVRSGALFNLRSDYGSTWEGEFIVKNCRLVPRGGKPVQSYLINGGYSGQHDFGYVCYMPRRILIDGLVIDDAAHPKNYNGPYVFADFNAKYRSADYKESFPYQITEEVVLKNVTTTSGKPIALSPNKYMFRNVKQVQ